MIWTRLRKTLVALAVAALFVTPAAAFAHDRGPSHWRQEQHYRHNDWHQHRHYPPLRYRARNCHYGGWFYPGSWNCGPAYRDPRYRRDHRGWHR